MKDPVRLREAGTDDVRALLKHVRGPTEMNAAAFARGQRRVARLAAVPVAFSLVFWLKGVAFGAGIGVAAIAGAEVVQLARAEWAAPPPESSGPPSVVLIAPPKKQEAPPEPAPPVPNVAPSSQPATAPRGTVAPPPPNLAVQDELVEPLAREAELLESARGALGSAPARSLALTREHAREFPSGQLSLEREIVAIEALQKLGRRTEARARADALLRTAPGTHYEERIRNLLPEPR
jgi:hypothetical protein